jgi:hypothetical protein
MLKHDRATFKPIAAAWVVPMIARPRRNMTGCVKMSDEGNKYRKELFNARLEATPARIKEIVNRWLYKEPHEVSVHIEEPKSSGTVIFLFIQLRLNDDKDQYGKPHKYAGIVDINGDALGSHVKVEFFDWESAEDRTDACKIAELNNYATMPNQQKIFDQLVQALRLGAPVRQDNPVSPTIAEVSTSAVADEQVYVPKRKADFQNWKIYWKKVKPYEGLTMDKILEKVENDIKFSNVRKYGKDTIRKIVTAGRAGKLD